MMRQFGHRHCSGLAVCCLSNMFYKNWWTVSTPALFRATMTSQKTTAHSGSISQLSEPDRPLALCRGGPGEEHEAIQKKSARRKSRQHPTSTSGRSKRRTTRTSPCMKRRERRF
uniref:(northern house mosquito) hypothetical protein n=1 Tax=Culex pipiens TaxID=7175 RepID=A0A8D8BJN2_CULPI